MFLHIATRISKIKQKSHDDEDPTVVTIDSTFLFPSHPSLPFEKSNIRHSEERYYGGTWPFKWKRPERRFSDLFKILVSYDGIFRLDVFGIT